MTAVWSSPWSEPRGTQCATQQQSQGRPRAAILSPDVPTHVASPGRGHEAHLWKPAAGSTPG